MNIEDIRYTEVRLLSNKYVNVKNDDMLIDCTIDKEDSIELAYRLIFLGQKILYIAKDMED